jgi:hypothetical protein
MTIYQSVFEIIYIYIYIYIYIFRAVHGGILVLFFYCWKATLTLLLTTLL